MESFCVLFLIAFLSFEATVGKASGVDANTLSGQVTGYRQSTQFGKVNTFLGIPYAKPPVGDLRFKRPSPVDKWCEARNATKFSNACTQFPTQMFGEDFKGEAMWISKSETSEDCLYLNIWAPHNHLSRHEPLTPVLVWIYGGGFNGGSSDLDLYDGALVASKNNLIVVSFNYRTGVLGFLDVKTSQAPGNVGLLDQQLAMQWIKDNIIFFGGNPEEITIAGESAGSFSVNFHLLSPGSRNLFKRAIMQSSSAYSEKAVISADAKIRSASKLATAANCSYTDAAEFPNEVVKCLRKLPSDKLNALELGLYSIPIGYAFSPTVDGHFLPDHPMKMIDRGDFKRTQLLTGTNGHEGTYFLIYDFANHFSKDHSSLLSRGQSLRIIKTMFHFLSKDELDALKFHYYRNAKEDNKAVNRDIVAEMLGDWIFLCPVNRFAEIMALEGQDVYYYHFIHRSRNNPWAQWMGVLHGDEIEYVFGRPLAHRKDFLKEEWKLSERMMDHWSNFVKTGNPSVPGVKWPKYSKEDNSYLILHGKQKGVMKGPRTKNCAFWNHLLPDMRKNKLITCK